MELEALADPNETGCYPFAIQGGIIDPQPMLEELISDWRAAVPLPTLSARFHNSLVNMSLEVCQAIRRRSSAGTVALSGGVWQNMFLLRHTLLALKSAGFQVLIHHLLPPNDGCIALGQALIAAKASL
jgi:hydrogenase maturation protein HypF